MLFETSFTANSRARVDAVVVALRDLGKSGRTPQVCTSIVRRQGIDIVGSVSFADTLDTAAKESVTRIARMAGMIIDTEPGQDNPGTNYYICERG